MASFSKILLSGGTQGKFITIAATATAGTLLHTAVAGTGASYDEIWLYADNNSSTATKLTIEFGEAAPSIEVTIPGESGLTLVVPGLLLQNELTVKAYAATANVILMNGYVNRIA